MKNYKPPTTWLQLQSSLICINLSFFKEKLLFEKLVTVKLYCLRDIDNIEPFSLFKALQKQIIIRIIINLLQSS